MADLPISGLPAAASLALTDEFAINKAGTTEKATGQQIVDLVGVVNQPIILSVGDLYTETGDVNAPEIVISLDEIGNYNLTTSLNIVYGGMTIPQGVDQSSPMPVSVVWSSSNGLGGTVHLDFRYSRSVIGDLPSSLLGGVTIANSIDDIGVNVEETLDSISNPLPGELINFELKFLEGPSSYTGIVQTLQVKFSPVYL